MPMKVTNGLDLLQTAIINALLHPVTSDPVTPSPGQIWFRTDTDELRVQLSTGPVTLATGGGITSLIQDVAPQLGGMLDVNGNSIGDGTNELVSFVEDASAVNQVEIENEATGGGPIIRGTGDDTNVDLNFQTKGSGAFNFTGDIAVTGSVDGRDLAADGTKLDGVLPGAQPTDASTVDAAGATMNTDTDLTGNGWFVDDDTMAANDATKAVSQQSLVAYVASQLSAVAGSVDDYDASTNTPDLDVAPGAGTIFDSNQFYVTVAGLFFTEQVEVGDLLIARQDDPTTLAHWVVANRNLDVASESAAGILRVGTQVEVDAGVLDNVAVTPAKLAGIPRVYTETIGDGATLVFPITHNLGKKAFTWSVRDTGTDEMVLNAPVATTSNQATLTFDVVTTPGVGQYEVTIIG